MRRHLHTLFRKKVFVLLIKVYQRFFVRSSYHQIIDGWINVLLTINRYTQMNAKIKMHCQHLQNNLDWCKFSLRQIMDKLLKKIDDLRSFCLLGTSNPWQNEHPVCLFVYLFVYLLIYSFIIHLFIYISIYLFQLLIHLFITYLLFIHSYYVCWLVMENQMNIPRAPTCLLLAR